MSHSLDTETHYIGFELALSLQDLDFICKKHFPLPFEKMKKGHMKNTIDLFLEDTLPAAIQLIPFGDAKQSTTLFAIGYDMTGRSASYIAKEETSLRLKLATARASIERMFGRLGRIDEFEEPLERPAPLAAPDPSLQRSSLIPEGQMAHYANMYSTQNGPHRKHSPSAVQGGASYPSKNKSFESPRSSQTPHPSHASHGAHQGAHSAQSGKSYSGHRTDSTSTSGSFEKPSYPRDQKHGAHGPSRDSAAVKKNESAHQGPAHKSHSRNQPHEHHGNSAQAKKRDHHASTVAPSAIKPHSSYGSARHTVNTSEQTHSTDQMDQNLAHFTSLAKTIAQDPLVPTQAQTQPTALPGPTATARSEVTHSAQEPASSQRSEPQGRFAPLSEVDPAAAKELAPGVNVMVSRRTLAEIVEDQQHRSAPKHSSSISEKPSSPSFTFSVQTDALDAQELAEFSQTSAKKDKPVKVRKNRYPGHSRNFKDQNKRKSFSR